MNRSEKARKGEEFLSQWFLAFLGYNNLENSVSSQKRAFHFRHRLRSFNSFDFTGPQKVIVWGVSSRALCLFMGSQAPLMTYAFSVLRDPRLGHVLHVAARDRAEARNPCWP